MVAGGNLYVQEQLGIGMHTAQPRPYSLIGAACDYVPVHEILHAVSRQEESRLVREWILRSTAPPPNAHPLMHGSPQPALTSLAELGLSQAAALNQLIRRHPELFDPARVPRQAERDDLQRPAPQIGRPSPTTAADMIVDGVVSPAATGGRGAEPAVAGPVAPPL